MRALLVQALILLGFGLALVHPIYGACLLVFNNIFRPFDWAMAGDPFRIGTTIIVVFALSYLVGLVRGAFRPQLTPASLFILAFLLACAASAAFAPDPYLARDGLVKVLKYLGPVFFISTLLRSERDIHYLLYTLALSVGIYAAQAGLHSLLVGRPVTDMAIPGAQMMDRNDFIVGVLAAYPLLGYMVRHYSGPFAESFGRFIRPGLGILLLFSLVAIPMSLSRGGILGLAASLLLIAFLSRKRLRNFLLLLFLLPLAFALTPSSVLDRMGTIEISREQSEGSANERVGQMKGGLRLALDNPWTGVGPYAFLSYIPRYTGKALEPHSVWIKAAAEVGFVGLLVYVLGILVLVTWTFRYYRRFYGIDPRISTLAIALGMSHIGYNVGATFLSQLYSEYYWLLLALTGAFLRFAGRREKELEEEGLPAREPENPEGSGEPGEPGAAEANATETLGTTGALSAAAAPESTPDARKGEGEEDGMALLFRRARNKAYDNSRGP